MKNTQFPLPQNLLNIPGPVGPLEAIIAPPAIELAPIVSIICHPQPTQGGTMQNKVVSTLARAFYDLGIWSVRFNFRGVGASAGVYDNGQGEVDDLLAIATWVQQYFPSHALWLSGFSFGGYIALQGAMHPELIEQVKQLITVAPALNYLYFPKNVTTIRCPWLLIMGENDEVVSTQGVKDWIDAQSAPVTAIYLPEVGHFFHGHLIDLRERLKERLKIALTHS